MSDDVGLFLRILGLGIFIISMFIIFRCILADGRMDYCYIESGQTIEGNSRLYAHIPWRFNRYVETVSSIDMAKSEAQKLGCELH